MEKTYLQWNLANWLTVVLMASVGVIIIGTLAGALQTYRNGGGGGET